MNAGGVLNTCKSNEAEGGNSFQSSGGRVSNTWVTCPDDWDNPRKLGLIPNVPSGHKAAGERKLRPPHRDGPAAH